MDLTIVMINIWIRQQQPVLQAPHSDQFIAPYVALLSRYIEYETNGDLIYCFRVHRNHIPSFFFYYRLVSEPRKITSKIRLGDFFFKPDIVQRQDNYDSFIRGLLTQHAQEVDQYFTEEVPKIQYLVVIQQEWLAAINYYVDFFIICIDKWVRHQISGKTSKDRLGQRRHGTR